MSIKMSHARLMTVSAALLLPTAARADVVWPALILEHHLLSAPVIALGLVIEALVLRFAFAMTWRRSCIAAIVVNAISTALGILLIPIAGIAWEFFAGVILYKFFQIGTFNPLTWAATFLLASVVTTSIEVFCLRRFFDVPANKRTWLLWAVPNAATVGLAFASLAFGPPRF